MRISSAGAAALWLTAGLWLAPAGLPAATAAGLHSEASISPSHPSKETPAGVFEEMQKGFLPQKARGVHARYQFKIKGAAGGLWWIIVEDGTCHFGRGPIEKPDVTILASDRDWVMLSRDTLSPAWAWLTGRLRVEGSKPLARKLDEMFP